jgi:hypothetical protein
MRKLFSIILLSMGSLFLLMQNVKADVISTPNDVLQYTFGINPTFFWICLAAVCCVSVSAIIIIIVLIIKKSAKKK